MPPLRITAADDPEWSHDLAVNHCPEGPMTCPAVPCLATPRPAVPSTVRISRHKVTMCRETRIEPRVTSGTDCTEVPLPRLAKHRPAESCQTAPCHASHCRATLQGTLANALECGPCCQGTHCFRWKPLPYLARPHHAGPCQALPCHARIESTNRTPTSCRWTRFEPRVAP